MRIEECIQRFRARRRLTNERNHLFSRYLALGGVETTQRLFGGTVGIDKSDMEDQPTASQVRLMAADDVIRSNTSSKFFKPHQSQGWDVDFEGVAAGYFSYHLPSMVNYSVPLTHAALDTIDNFLRYVLRHDVCNEHCDDVKRAREICLKAATELPACYDLMKLLPGDFNLACTALFCKDDDFCNHILAENDLDPARVFKTTVALQPGLVGAKTLQMAKSLESIEVVQTTHMELEIQRCEQPAAEIIGLYDGVKSKGKGKIRAVGAIILKHFRIEDGWERKKSFEQNLQTHNDEILLVEHVIIDAFQKGRKNPAAAAMPRMKMRVEVCELNTGLKFIKRLDTIRPSFYTFLPQELMFNYKEPDANQREAPSVDNPLLEETQEARETERETDTGDKTKEVEEESEIFV
jgi:hypothetical protein